jgi:hypothetical protein
MTEHTERIGTSRTWERFAANRAVRVLGILAAAAGNVAVAIVGMK